MNKFLAKFFDITFWKFILVGAINTLFGTGIMFLFYNVFHLNYWVSSASNYFFGSVLSYFLNRFFTFKNKCSSVKSIALFIMNISVCYFVAYGIARPIVSILVSGLSKTIRDNLSMLAGMCIFVILNYLGQRFIVFKNRKN